MKYEAIDWGHSIEQQIEGTFVTISTARKLVRQIRYKRDAHPELITRENYVCFQMVIHSMAQLVSEVEASPLYKEALAELRDKQRRKQQRIVARHFGYILS